MAKTPTKASLDAESDQQMAALRDVRADLEEAGDAEILTLAEALAVLLREQFPADAALGRITLAVAGALESILAATEVRGRKFSRWNWWRSPGLPPSSLTGRGHREPPPGNRH